MCFLFINDVVLRVVCVRTHTAVKIAPRYTSPVIHVLDASRSVVVVRLCFLMLEVLFLHMIFLFLFFSFSFFTTIH